jgi:Uma2 family endonuclease
MSIPLPTRRFTVDEYYRMAETGVLSPDERVELIEGEIVKMPCIESRHAPATEKHAASRVAKRSALSHSPTSN